MTSLYQLTTEYRDADSPDKWYSHEAVGRMIQAAVAAERKLFKEVGFVCKDGFPALIGNRPLKPTAKLYAMSEDWL